MPPVVGRPFDPPAIGGPGVQVLNVPVNDQETWTEIDVSAEFAVGETPVSVRALIVMGSDPDSAYAGPVDFRFRKSGDTVEFENAQGISGEGRLMELDGSNEYLSGGFVAEMIIPVSEEGKFEYQLRNRAEKPRNIIKLLEVSTSKIGQTLRVRVDKDDFSDASMTKLVDLITLPAGAVVESVSAVIVTPFTGPGISAYTVEVGQDVGPDPDAFLLAQDVTDVANTIYGNADGHIGADLDGAGKALFSVTATMKVQAEANSTGANLDAATAGELDVYITFRSLPLP